MNPAPEPRSLETSETEFARYYAPYAASGLLYPQREGSPLLEFSAGGRVLYLFDRCGPYAAPPGEARVVVHAILDLAHTEVLSQGEVLGQGGGEQSGGKAPEESLQVCGVSVVEGCGTVQYASRRTWVVQARLPFVLSDFGPLPPAEVGSWVRFRTLAPLHGFVLER